MQETTYDTIKSELNGSKGHILVKIPKSKLSLLCICNSNWTIKLINPSQNTVETVKENISRDNLNSFISNILNADVSKINKKELKKLIK